MIKKPKEQVEGSLAGGSRDTAVRGIDPKGNDISADLFHSRSDAKTGRT